MACLLALSDVLGDSRYPVDAAPGIPDRRGAIAYPANGAVRSDDTVLVVIVSRDLTVHDVGFDPGTVLRMYGLHPQSRSLIQRVAGATPDSLETGADVQHLGLVQVGHPEHFRDVFRHLPKAFFAEPQPLLRLAMFVPVRRLAQLPFDAGRQSSEIALDDVVVGTGLHDVHRDVFADCPGDYDEGEVETGPSQQLQRGATIEARQTVVTDDNIPGLPGECGRHRFGCVDPQQVGVVASVTQLTREQLRVIIGVLDKQHSQRTSHGRQQVSRLRVAISSGRTASNPVARHRHPTRSLLRAPRLSPPSRRPNKALANGPVAKLQPSRVSKIAIPLAAVLH